MTDQPRVALPALGEHQAVHTDEHRVVGHELDAHANRGGCDPAIRLVDLLAERMTRSLALGADLGARAHQLVVWLHNDQTSEVTFQTTATKLSPPGLQGSVAHLGDGCERDDDRTVGDLSRNLAAGARSR